MKPSILDFEPIRRIGFACLGLSQNEVRTREIFDNNLNALIINLLWRGGMADNETRV